MTSLKQEYEIHISVAAFLSAAAADNFSAGIIYPP